MREEILRIEKVSKEIDGILYLDNVNFHIFKGEVMGLIPINNHGKSQLIELISQNISIDFGRIYFDENLVNNYEYSNMTNNKVYLIDKRTKLVEDLKVMDNIHVLNHKFDSFIIRKRNLQVKTDQLIKELNINIKTNQYISELSVFEKTLIELVKAVINDVQLIILDEISNFLSVEEVFEFQKLVKYYTEKGISFIYMANHHEEVFDICHRVCLFENGRVTKVINKEEFSDEVIGPFTINFANSSGINESDDGSEIFAFKNFTTENLRDISFSLKRGECITILDINNKGIQDIVQILSGKISPIKGNIILDSERVEKVTPYNMLVNKITYIPENPVDEILFHDMSYLDNLTFLLDYKLDRRIINRNVFKSIKEEYRYIVGKDIDEGNLQNLSKKSLYNLVYLRTLLFSPRVVFIMQPFSNADLYLRGRIIELINQLKAKGIGIVILAVSISDTLTVSDRLLVMEKGQILRNYSSENFSK